MTSYKIAVYAICKNEVQFVDRWMDSMKEADLVVVTDTGSEDGTVEALKRRGAIVHVERVQPWRFDVARNLSLDRVPEDVDICVSTDLDEYFNPGWREKLEAAWRDFVPAHAGEVARSGRYLYNWSLKPDGTPDVQFNYFKVHQRRGFRWKCPVHEHVQYEGNLPHEAIFIEGMVLNHAPDPQKSRGSYLPLLELAVAEDPMSDRMRYYLGREYLFKGEWQKCVETLSSYLAMPGATWNEERCAAMRWIAKSCLSLGRHGDAYAWYYRAIAEAPHMRDPFVEFARMCHALGDWPMALYLAEEALNIAVKSATYVNMGYAWDHTPDDLSAIAAYHMGLPDRAIRHAEAALAFAPEDERLKKNLEIVRAMRGA